MLTCNGCFGLFAEIKKGDLGLAFGAHFLRFILDQPLKQWLTGGKKEGKMEIQKFEYLENEKSFSHEIENMFHSF